MRGYLPHSISLFLMYLLFSFYFRDIENEHEDKTKLVSAISVLTKLFAIGEPLPVIYFGRAK